ncbi:MAG: hypothetical protein D6713_09070 [Deltaproteobacteria bacterium]|nr:MAG: hypothetical protein D6713_09070 [Deltaproteobacteria bacterium]
MNLRYDILLNLNRLDPVSRGEAKLSPEKVAKKVESLFLNELLKVMLQETSFGKERVFSTYMPIITSQVADYLAGRETGMAEMLLKNPVFRESLENTLSRLGGLSIKNSSPSVDKVNEEQETRAGGAEK